VDRDRKLKRAIIIIALLCAVIAAAMIILAVSLLKGTDDEEYDDTPLPQDKTTLYSALEIPDGGSVTDAIGTALTLDDLKGQPAILLFWSSWCSDCKEFFADGYEKMKQAAQESGMRLLLVCREGIHNDNRASAEKALAQYGITDGTWMDEDALWYRSTGLGAVPGIAVLNDDGLLVHVTSSMPDAGTVKNIAEYAGGGRNAQSDQLIKSLMTQPGALPSAFEIKDGALISGDTYLSETEGLLLQYALLSGDGELFDNTFSFIKDSMSANDLTYWTMTGDEKGNVNASLDDLRIAGQLALAAALWTDRAEELNGYAYNRAAALYNAAVPDGYLHDFADLSTGGTAENVTLCYQGISAMETLSVLDARWQYAAEKARGLLEEGLISEEFPLYYRYYDVSEKAYKDDEVQMNEAMVTVLNAAKAGILKESTVSWIEEQLSGDGVFAVYTADGKPKSGYEYESTATYALIVQTGIVLGRDEMVRLALSRMESFRCHKDPLAGGYGTGEDGSYYMFDDCEALIALTMLETYD